MSWRRPINPAPYTPGVRGREVHRSSDTHSKHRRRPRFGAMICLVVSMGLGCAGDSSIPFRPPIVVYLIDTLRPDHLSAYGYGRPTSPSMEAFARDGVSFQNALAQSSWTKPAVASLFTGLSPQLHGTLAPRDGLSPELPLLAEILQQAGYRTLGVVANGNASNAFGFGRGFDRYRQLPERFTPEVHRRSDEVNQVVFRWLAENTDSPDPLFLYIHTADPHAPYTPPRDYRKRFAPTVEEPGFGSLEHLRELAARNKPRPGELEGLRALYDGEIAFNDASFGALLERLREFGIYDAALIVLLSDHGEGFGEHGQLQHGKTLFGEEQRIPLMIKLPAAIAGSAARNVWLQEPVAQVDILPTLLDILNLATPPGGSGRSLVPLMLRAAAPAEPAPPIFSSFENEQISVESVTQGDRKLIKISPRGAPSRNLLFDPQQDRGERRRLEAREPATAHRLNERLEALHREAASRTRAPEVEIDEGLRARLEALGYL
ncbi:sulfatase [Myxococcota bacterium]|nr:sulfatase [Myxococcota bacterium]